MKLTYRLCLEDLFWVPVSFSTPRDVEPGETWTTSFELTPEQMEDLAHAAHDLGVEVMHLRAEVVVHE